MRKITDYKEVSPTVLKYFKRGVITNNFLTAEDYKAEIAEGRLYFLEEKDFLNIYLLRDGFFILYFYILDESCSFPKISKKVVCDIAGDVPLAIKNGGFLKSLQRVRLEREKECEEKEISPYKADTANSEEIYKVMLNSLNKYSGYVPTHEQIKKECEEGLIYIVKDGKKIAGVLRSGVKGKVAEIKHLCVLEEFRKRGYARFICNEFLKENKDKKCIVWTGIENEAALSLYKSLGFLKSEMSSLVYIKEEDKND